MLSYRIEASPTSSLSAMKMFADMDDQYGSKQGASSSFPSTYHSSNHLLSSEASASSIEMSSMLTPSPTSRRRRSFGSVKIEDASFSASSLAYAQDRFGSSNSFHTSSMPQDLFSGFADMNMMFSSGERLPADLGLIEYNNFSTYINPSYDSVNTYHRLSMRTPSLDMGLFSPTSGIDPSFNLDDPNFIVPSQTTLIDTFNMQSPIQPAKIRFDVNYDNFTPEYVKDFSPVGVSQEDISYFMPSYNESRPASTETQPSSLRQPFVEPMQTSARLHCVQKGVNSRNLTRVGDEAERRGNATRLTRRRLKREIRNCPLSDSIRIQNKAKKECPHAGCNVKFQRQEHLKRHEKTHLKHPEVFPCVFCQKPFGRSDNLKSHIKLHMKKDKKSARTDYYEGAAEVFRELSRKPRKTGNRSGEAKLSRAFEY